MHLDGCGMFIRGIESVGFCALAFGERRRVAGCVRHKHGNIGQQMRFPRIHVDFLAHTVREVSDNLAPINRAAQVDKLFSCSIVFCRKQTGDECGGFRLLDRCGAHLEPHLFQLLSQLAEAASPNEAN